ncbi:nucleotidyltransferase domain-containing protein [Candidatus Woesearchaeota archaeon]|nr:nucleotidyltransferase domain-containing protein [Candidatus Woesearchaeota archaeon]
MAKKTTKKVAKKEEKKEQMPKGVPPEVQEKLKAIKEKLDKFSKTIVEKFDKYIVGVALLPPPRPPAQNLPPDILAEEKKHYDAEKDKFHTLVLVDDSEPTKMSKLELRDKINAILMSTAKDIDKNIVPQVVLLSQLWQNCFDQKYDLLRLISMSAPIYDTGMLGAIRIAELHKTMVLKKFEKYIVSYVMGGSLVQGKSTKDSDIDVFVVIDDTDVKKMTRAELKDKLRAIIIGMGMEAGERTGIKNKFNIQVYILTDFWDSIREANPVIFTFLRDGVPFYDRGVFMPWKQLLRMGKIKPSAEAIDMYMSSGAQMLDRVKRKLMDIGTEDFFWSLNTPSNAALMLYGVPPPTPKEQPELMREIFVKKLGLLEDEYVKILENVIKVRKDIEHGHKKEVTGKEIDKMREDCDKYMKRLKKLFTQIEKIKEEESMVKLYDSMQTLVRDVLKLEGMEKVEESKLLKVFEDVLVTTGKVPAKFLRNLQSLLDAKKDYDAGKLTKTDVEKAKKESGELFRYLVEYMQRARARDLARAKIKIKHGEKIAEITLLGKTAFIIPDLGAKEQKLQKAAIKADGSLSGPESCSFEELEKALAKLAVPERVAFGTAFFESLKKIFGEYEVLF